MIRRFVRWLMRPARSVPAAAILVLGGVGGVVFWGGFHGFMGYSNTMEFCISCHEMEANPYAEYKETVHFQNASGVRATCADCHVPEAYVDKVVRKVHATKELFAHWRGELSTPAKYEAKRLEMAERVWAQMEANDSQECRNCHTYEAMDFHAQGNEAAEQMQAAFGEGETCISCHKGIAHEMPDMTAGYRTMFTKLDAAELGRADHAWAYRIKQLAPSADEPDARAGRLLPMTEVAVVDREGDLLKVRLEGWQQDGNDRVIYQRMGQRIFAAALDRSVIDRIERHDTRVDPETELTWHRVSLEAWTDPASMSADHDALNELGAELYNASCSTCHSLNGAEHHLANQWIGTLKAMKRFITLDQDKYYYLQTYLQQNARDVAGGAGHGS